MKDTGSLVHKLYSLATIPSHILKLSIGIPLVFSIIFAAIPPIFWRDISSTTSDSSNCSNQPGYGNCICSDFSNSEKENDNLLLSNIPTNDEDITLKIGT